MVLGGQLLIRDNLQKQMVTRFSSIGCCCFFVSFVVVVANNDDIVVAVVVVVIIVAPRKLTLNVGQNRVNNSLNSKFLILLLLLLMLLSLLLLKICCYSETSHKVWSKVGK